MREFEKTPDWWNSNKVNEVFQTDLNAQKQSTNFILLLPAGRSAHIEAGIAYGLGKNCILIGKQEAAESLYLIFNRHYDTPSDFLETI